MNNTFRLRFYTATPTANYRLAKCILILIGVVIVSLLLLPEISTTHKIFPIDTARILEPLLLQMPSQEKQKTNNLTRTRIFDSSNGSQRNDPWHTPTSYIDRSTESQIRFHRRRTEPLILFYDKFFCNEWGTLEDVYVKYFDELSHHHSEKPSCYSCESTTDHSLFAEASIVVFHLPDLVSVPQKYCGQYFALISLEAPPYYDEVDPVRSMTQSYNQIMFNYFDISSTYRLDSDVPLPHFTFWYEHKLLDALLKPPRFATAERDKDYPVVWIASKCETSNNRLAYVKELMNYIGIKSYGKCLHNSDIPAGSSYDIEATEAISRHKFHLTFENSNWYYYVTEKLTRTLELGVIPVIMGAPQIHQFLPSNQSAILVDEFVSSKELAKRLHEINSNDALFESYLA